MNDTIFALSSGQGKSGVAVIRVSGNDLRELFSNVCSDPGDSKCPVAGKRDGNESEIIPRHAYLCHLVDQAGERVDQCIALYFAAPASFTGEDVIEIHCHGSAPVIKKTFEVLKSHGCRMARPGEFSRRAFDNGKMDLVAADGLAMLLDARTDRQRAHALRAATGADSDVYMGWRRDMIDLAAMSSAMIDYPEDDLPRAIADKIKARTRKLYAELSAALSGTDRARAIRSGFDIALVGCVNAGKSSLFNRLVGESRAIVSDIPGTTRDVVHAEIDIDGYLVRLMDTAGLRATDDAIERIGIDRTHRQIETADLILHLKTAGDPPGHVPKSNEIAVRNKSDETADRSDADAVYVSALTGQGMDDLRAEIRRRMHSMLDSGESDIAVSARAKALLADAVCELKSALATATPDLSAEHIRAAADAMGRVLGMIGVDEVADAVFGQFCLGK